MDRPLTPPKLPKAIPELQRILLEAEDANRASVERLRRVFAGGSGGNGERPVMTPPAERSPEDAAVETEEELAILLQERITRAGVVFVFGNKLDRVWPPSATAVGQCRITAIQEFARRNEWDVYLMNGGHLAMFRPRK